MSVSGPRIAQREEGPPILTSPDSAVTRLMSLPKPEDP